MQGKLCMHIIFYSSVIGKPHALTPQKIKNKKQKQNKQTKKQKTNNNNKNNKHALNGKNLWVLSKYNVHTTYTSN